MRRCATRRGIVVIVVVPVWSGPAVSLARDPYILVQVPVALPRPRKLVQQPFKRLPPPCPRRLPRGPVAPIFTAVERSLWRATGKVRVYHTIDGR